MGDLLDYAGSLNLHMFVGRGNNYKIQAKEDSWKDFGHSFDLWINQHRGVHES